MNTLLWRLRYNLRTRLGCYEWPYMALTALKRSDGQGQTRVDRDTDIVIEAFPRSGNTFAVQAFSHAQPNPVRIAHHFHAPAQVLRATRLGVPALVILRPPEDAVLSFVIREPVVPIRAALAAWLAFYETLSRRPCNCVVATFDEVTNDFGGVIRRVNQRFGRSFGLFEHTPENVEACFKAIEARNAQRFGAGRVEEHRVARPSEHRRARKAELQADYRRYTDLHRRATEVYAALAAHERGGFAGTLFHPG